MGKWSPILIAAVLWLGLAPRASAQPLELDWADGAGQGPSVDVITQRLEDEAARQADQAKVDQDPRRPPIARPRTVAIDFVYPVAPDEYRALGANGVILVSVVVHDPKELPLKRVTLRFGFKEVDLQPIADRRSTIPPASTLGKTIGVDRDDAFFLLPGKLPGKTAHLWVYFSVPGRSYDAARLSLALPDAVKALAETPPGRPDQAVLRKVLAREYPSLVKPERAP